MARTNALCCSKELQIAEIRYCMLRTGKADQFSNLRGTGILPVAEHGQDARATSNIVTQLE